MLILVGDILNWLAAGVLFPLTLLPLAGVISARRLSGTAMWVLLAAGLAAGGAAFAALAPDLAEQAARASLARRAAIFAGFLAAGAAAVAALGGPRQASARLAPLAGAISRAAGRAAMWLVLLMALVQFAVVILRYVFGVNFLAMQESITYMHGAVFLLAAGYALLTDDQVRVDIFYRSASPRRKALIDFLGSYLLLFPACLLILWSAAPYVAQSWAVREGSNEQSGIQAVFLLKSLIPAFAALLALAGFAITTRAGETLRGRAGGEGG